jgi:hypothetical protein
MKSSQAQKVFAMAQNKIWKSSENHQQLSQSLDLCDYSVFALFSMTLGRYINATVGHFRVVATKAIVITQGIRFPCV